VVVLVALGVASFVWGRVSRADSLRAFDARLTAAMTPVQQYLDPLEAQPLSQVPLKFGRGQVGAIELKTDAAQWEKDFTAARDRVMTVRAPREAIDARDTFVQALDAYRGLARFYFVVAQEEQIAQSMGGATQTQVANQVQLMLTHLSEAKMRADASLELAQRELDALKRVWGVRVKPKPRPGRGGAGGLAPGGGLLQP